MVENVPEIGLRWISSQWRWKGEKAKIQIKYSNNDIVKIYKTQPASVFCEAQHLKCIGRVLGCKQRLTKTMAPYASSQKPGKPVDKIAKCLVNFPGTTTTNAL